MSRSSSTPTNTASPLLKFFIYSSLSSNLTFLSSTRVVSFGLRVALFARFTCHLSAAHAPTTSYLHSCRTFISAYCLASFGIILHLLRSACVTLNSRFVRPMSRPVPQHVCRHTPVHSRHLHIFYCLVHLLRLVSSHRWRHSLSSWHLCRSRFARRCCRSCQPTSSSPKSPMASRFPSCKHASPSP